MTVIAGIDLAWSGRKPTGICLLEVGAQASRVLNLLCTDGDASAVAKLLADLGPDVVAGIDAPLLVGPARRAEAELARAYGKRGVYAYAARQDFLERHGILEGPRLGALLSANGWNLDPSAVTAGATGCHAFEVFPHATTVVLLGAERVLRYKKGPLASRMAPLQQFATLLTEYAARNLPCLVAEIAAVLPDAAVQHTGRTLKDIEDRLDAAACAVAAFHAWKFGAAGLEVFGDVQNGYIAVPKRD
jgi:predicted RNase H-like nuclease